MPQSFTIENTVPGVTVLVNQSQVARPVQRQPSSTFFVVGYSPWGPVNTPKPVTSWPDYVRQFGGFDTNSYLDDALYTFFNVFPGTQAVVCRVVGAAAAVGTLTLKDRSSGAGINTLRVDAKYPSSRVDLKVQVADGAQANTFKLIVTSQFFGATETFDNLTVSVASLDEVNQRSRLVKLTNLNSATAAPNNNPRVLAATSLTGGTDDFAGLNAASYIGTDSGTTKTGLQTFKDFNLGGGQVALPGLTADTVHAALIAHAETYHRLALLDPPFAADKAAVATVRANYGTPNAALYWPWVQMLDFSGTGLKQFYPPSGFAAGACAQVDRSIGTHKAPANITLPGALDVERYGDGSPQVDDNTREYLNARDVNVIVPFVNQGIKIYGARVLAGSDKRVQFVHEARLLNLFYHSAKQAYAWAPFAVVDGQGRLFRDLAATGAAFLRQFWRDGALYGRREQDAYIVVADDSNNPAEELAVGRVHVQWGVRLSPTAEIIIVSIDAVPLTQDLSVLQS